MSSALVTSSTESVLLVQCCHLPQFFYLAEKLRQRHPEWNLSALVSDRPHVRSYLELFPSFDHLFFFDKNLPETLDAFDQILFPLLNRGYLRIKRAAWRLPGTAYEIDFQGERRALSPGTLVRSFARPLHRPPKEFVQYLEDFPPSPILSPTLFFPTDEDSKAASGLFRQSEGCTDLGKPEGGSGPGPLPSRRCLLDLLSSTRFPAAEAVICPLSGETSAGLQPGPQLLLSERPPRPARPTIGLGNVAPRAAHAKPAWRPHHVVFPHGRGFQSRRGNRKAARSQGGLASTHLGLLPRGQAVFLPGPARGGGGSDLCSGAG